MPVDEDKKRKRRRRGIRPTKEKNKTEKTKQPKSNLAKKRKPGKPLPGWQDVCADYMVEFFEERAAIHEYHAGLSRERSEFIAWHAMLRKYWGPSKKS